LNVIQILFLGFGGFSIFPFYKKKKKKKAKWVQKNLSWVEKKIE
jgi:hypothetical protein